MLISHKETYFCDDFEYIGQLKNFRANLKFHALGTMLVWLMKNQEQKSHTNVPLSKSFSHRQAFLLETITKDDFGLFTTLNFIL